MSVRRDAPMLCVSGPTAAEIGEGYKLRTALSLNPGKSFASVVAGRQAESAGIADPHTLGNRAVPKNSNEACAALMEPWFQIQSVSTALDLGVVTDAASRQNLRAHAAALKQALAALEEKL